MKYMYHKNGIIPNDCEIFVFGSNLAGRHGLGAAHVAMKKFGAEYGKGIGYMRGNKPCEHCYAIPTKDSRIKTLPLAIIERYIEEFKSEVYNSKYFMKQKFFITAIGCGYAGYRSDEIAPLFKNSPTNCIFPEEWYSWVEN